MRSLAIGQQVPRFRPFSYWVRSYRNGFGKRPKVGEVGAIVLRIADVSSGEIDLSSPRLGSLSKRDAETYRLYPGDLLFVRVNGAKEIVGRCCVVRDNVPSDTIFNDHLIRVRLEEGLDPEFARLCMSISSARQVIEAAASTSAGQLTVNQQILSSIEIPCLPLGEQRRIAARLKTQLAAADVTQAAANTRAKEIEALWAATYRDAFQDAATAGTGGTAASRFDWPIVPLREAAQIASGVTLGRKTKEANLITVPYLRVANVQDGRLDLGNVKTVEATRSEIEKWRLVEGDLLVTEGGDPDKLGRGACWQEELPLCIHQNHIFRIRLPRDRYDPAFVSAQFGSDYGKAYFLAHAKQTTGIATINQQVPGKFPLLSPPLEEQRRVAARLKTRLTIVEDLRRAAEAQRNDLTVLPSRLLSQAFDNL